MNDLTEPSPLWPTAPRYSSRPFPAYRFTPGVNPHPRGQAQGHSYGLPEEKPLRIPPENWQGNDLYLFGIDLYHQGYLWESHEAWEAMWHLTQKNDAEGQFLQGLIQNAAALLKVHQKKWDAARHLSHESWQRLCQSVTLGTCDNGPIWMGVDLPKLIQGQQAYFRPLWEGKEGVGTLVPTLPIVSKA